MDSVRVPLRSVADRVPSHRRRPHGALQLALGAQDRRRVRPPHRGHRPGAQHRGEPCASSSTRCGGSASTWDEGPERGRTARAVHADGAARRLPRARRAPHRRAARPTAATARRRSSTPSAPPSRRATPRRASATRAPAATGRTRPDRPFVVRFKAPAHGARHLRRQGLRRGDDPERRRSRTSSSCGPTACRSTTSAPSSTT